METCCEVKEAVPEDTIIIHIPVYLCWTHTASQPPLPSAYKGDHNTNMLNDEEDNPTNFPTSPAELKGPYSCQSSALWTSSCFSQGSPQWVNSLYQPYIFLPLILQNELPVLAYEVHKPPLGLSLVPALGILLQMCSLSLLSTCPVLSLDCSPLLPKHPASAVPLMDSFLSLYVALFPQRTSSFSSLWPLPLRHTSSLIPLPSCGPFISFLKRLSHIPAGILLWPAYCRLLTPSI